METSRGREERPGAAGRKLCVLFATACFLRALQNAAAAIWYRGMPEPPRSLRTPLPSLRAPGSGFSIPRLVHGGLTLPRSRQAAGVGAGGAGSATACPVASVAANLHRLLSDARPWLSFRGPGPPGSARGIRGGPEGKARVPRRPRGRRLESASAVGFMRIWINFTTSESCPMRHRERLFFFQVLGANLWSL